MKTFTSDKLKKVIDDHKLWSTDSSKGCKADLSKADLSKADLSYANLSFTNLHDADLSNANLSNANLHDANLTSANLSKANLSYASLYGANLCNVQGLKKVMGVKVNDIYWKRFDIGLKNFNYQYKVGLNRLREGEVFASDERQMCLFPGFHFASRDWCAEQYSSKPLEAEIRIPEGAQINEPWATDGKASADMIEILRVFDSKTGEDVTESYR